MTETILSLFEKQVRIRPENIALISGLKKLSYSELNAISNQYARLLSSLVKPGDRIGICFIEDSSAILISILAILKLGCLYIPIDPNNPEERIEYFIQSGEPRIVIGDNKTQDLISKYTQFVLFEDYQRMGNISKDNLLIEIKETSPAYIIFTSGSTGTPKGVMVSHGNLLNAYLAWEKCYNLKDINCHLQLTSYSFDVFSGDWIRSLCSGAKLIMCSEDISKDPEKLYRLIEQNKVECAEFLPVLLRGLFNYMEARSYKFNTMKLLICGSDKWFVIEYFRFKKFLTAGGRLINSYGTSETTIDTSYFEFTEENLFLIHETMQVPIGKPFPGMQLILLDQDFKKIKKGEVGEIYIGGCGVSLGYINAPDLNSEKFVQNIAGVSGLYFRTGDYGKELSSGDVEFLGRQDNQVKFKGKRISLTEIENALVKHFPISDCVVLFIEKEEKLIAFIVLRNVDDWQRFKHDLPQLLLNHIPEYMLPNKFLSISNLPTNLNGKIDRKVLLRNFMNNLYEQR